MSMSLTMCIAWMFYLCHCWFIYMSVRHWQYFSHCWLVVVFSYVKYNYSKPKIIY